jgi:serine/threonine protein kinase
MGTTGEFIGRRVGRFTITSHLASGGMAELFIARQEAVGGFEKDLVLKMLQERYSRNTRVVEMFLDEARLAAKLNHQNIVHVYDVNEAEGIRYIAMEYIHGETVTDIVRRSIARGTFLPLEHAIHIIAETAAGLAYAHDCRDLEGRPARIVHRDVSPSNILVTYEGLTKIVDFGIARVQDQIREESGMRPGKVSYMSPEQVRGEGADHRSDIFSLGIILYELTVGRRLWRGPPEVVMRRIVEELIPPPTYVRRDYPPALELIVMKALERRPADRYQSAGELQNELNEFMEESGLKSGSRRLSQYIKELFAPEGGLLRNDRVAEPSPADERPAESVANAADESEDLDFDRRAPLIMTVEARPAEEVSKQKGRAPVPPMQPSSEERAPRQAQRRAEQSPPISVSAAAVAARVAVASEPIRAKIDLSVVADVRSGASTAAPLSVGPPHGAVPAFPVESPSDLLDRPAGTGVGGSRLRWAILLLLAAAVVVVFLAAR